jgi:hypothetical protein
VKKALETPAFYNSDVRWLTAPSRATAVAAMLEPAQANLIIVFDDVSFILEGTGSDMELFKTLKLG